MSYLLFDTSLLSPLLFKRYVIYKRSVNLLKPILPRARKGRNGGARQCAHEIRSAQ